MKILVGCEMSDTVTMAFRALGHEAYSCDLLQSMHNSPYHWVGDVLDAAYNWQWDMGIFFPPCTYLARSGWHWVNSPDSWILPLKGYPRRRAAIEAAAFFMKLLNAPIDKICIENPQPIVHVGLPKSSQKIQPWQFGIGEVKETHLWLKNLPLLTPTNIVEGREAKVWKDGPGTDKNGLTRAMRRSITFPGIANAMAQQWGCLVA